MKKIFTFLMAAIVTLSMYAVTPAELGKKADPTGHAAELADKKLKHNKQVAKVLGLDKVERKAMPKTAELAKKAPQNETINLNYDAFAGMMYYEEEEQWWIGMSCDDIMRNEYGHNLNLEFTAPAASPCGTFTTKDFDYDYTHLTTPFSYGSIHFEEVNMTLSYEKVSENLERYILTATLVGEDGYTYIVNAKHENILAKGEVEVYVEDATLTQENGTFAVEGKNAELDIKLVVDNSDVIGTYGKNMILWEESKIAYKGTTLSPISFKAIVDLATHTETGDLAYVTEIKMMGNDTINYHIILAALLPEPADTVEVVCNDLEVDDSWAMMFGSVDFYASNSDYSISGGWQASYAEEGTFDAAVFLNTKDEKSITSLQAKVNVSLDSNNKWIIDGTMHGDDNVIYNLHLSWNVPTQTDTVVVSFANSAKAKYYTHVENSENDLQLYNENDLYSASINVANVELGGEFDEEYVIDFFTYLESKEGDDISVAEIKNGKLYQVGDTTKLEAEFATFEGVLYQVYLWYAAATPTKTVDMELKDAEFIMDFEYNGVYNLVGYTADSLSAVVFTVYATSKEDVPGTFVNDGMFGKFGEGQYDFDASNTYIGHWNELQGSYDLYYVQKGQFVVELDAEDNLTLTASLVCEDSVQYNITLTSKYEEPHIDYDSEDSPVNRVYSEDADLIINDRTEDYGLIYLQITDLVEGDVTAIYFVMSLTDSTETKIPVGTYEISNSWLDGTVLASTGIDMDWNVMPSYYAHYVNGYLEPPFYFFQTGTVMVAKDDEGNLGVEINAVNSCGIPVHIVYGNVAASVENINVNVDGVKKQIVGGQLVIIRDGKAYNAVGTQVK